MALFHIEHQTSYHYSRPVFIEPHIVRLRPRSDWRQALHSFHLQLEPAPVGLSWGFDLFDNQRAQAWFDGMHEELHVHVQAVVETLTQNPFDYLPQTASSAPCTLSESEMLSAFLRQRHPAPASGDRLELLLRDLDADAADMQRFLPALNLALYEQVDKISRLEPGILPPDVLLQQGRGACRDLAVAFIEACRRRAIPARYVSGYQTGDSDCETGDLHAWAEAYVPGGGWRGFDPTHGLAVADQHVVIAAGAEPEHTAPLCGTFRGTGVQAHLHHAVRIRVENGSQDAA